MPAERMRKSFEPHSVNCRILQTIIASANRALSVVGEVTRYAFRNNLGALQGQRILITASEALQQKTADQIRDLGGRPVQFPLIRLVCRHDLTMTCSDYDWLVITSPSSVRAFMEMVAAAENRLPDHSENHGLRSRNGR